MKQVQIMQIGVIRCRVGGKVNASGLQLQCAGIFLNAFLVPVLMYGSETMIWRRRSLECADGQPQRFVGYYENGQSAECTDKRVLWIDEGNI